MYPCLKCMCIKWIGGPRLRLLQNSWQNNNNTQIAAIALPPSTTHPQLWAELLTIEVNKNFTKIVLTTFSISLLTLGAHAQRGLQYLVCHSVCLSVCLSGHAILAVRAIKIIMKDTIVLSVRFAAILNWRFS